MLPIAAIHFAAAVVLFLSVATPEAVAASSPNEAAVVARLYRDYGWQAFANQTELFGEDITHQARATLEKYFAPELAALLMRDVACQRKYQGVCNVESDLLFDAEDPAVTDLEVKRIAPGRVSVEFNDPVTRKTTRIDFQLIQVGGQWKISDVVYKSGAGSLKQLLAREIR
jgi:hypothetical protein